jgi:hypothetical protein
MLPEFPGEYRASRRDWLIPGTYVTTTWYSLKRWYEDNPKN